MPLSFLLLVFLAFLFVSITSSSSLCVCNMAKNIEKKDGSKSPATVNRNLKRFVEKKEKKKAKKEVLELAKEKLKSANILLDTPTKLAVTKAHGRSKKERRRKSESTAERKVRKDKQAARVRASRTNETPDNLNQ
jgi:hypothetical protein